FFFSSRRRHTRFSRDWSSDVCSSDLSPTTPDLQSLRVQDDHAARVNAQLLEIQIAQELREARRSSADLLPSPETVEQPAVRFPRSEERRVGKESRSRRCT